MADALTSTLNTPESWQEVLTKMSSAAGEADLPAHIETELAKHREVAVPVLVEALQAGPEGRSIVAAKLLEVVRAPEGVPALVHILEKTPEFTRLGDAAVFALEAIGEPAREALYAVCERHKTDVDGDAYARAVEVLTRIAKDDRTWQYLKHGLRESVTMTGLFVALAGDYGDKRAVFYLNSILEERNDLRDRERAECLESLELLGGVPTDVARAKAAARSDTGPVGKVGRNDPCPCGSGKKYKKCCGK